MTIDHDRQQLRTVGLRVTAPRLATLAVVREQQHLTAEAIADQVRERLGSISKQAVYDVLAALTDAHLLRKVVLEGRGARYEVESGDNHHHVWCTRCGKFQDIPCVKKSAPCLQPPIDLGYTIEVADVVYRGLCPDCQAQDHQNEGN
ncbi:Fur family transcriptional regulator [Buchananella hordeovulneris]|uniref:Transcriptional repressor n=1 Tax=Buchananella hordeovulneris TaxID=52770 RepID=A0A1Q5PVG2_9ACTO|nr:Fur family transcriptional regulator [Buchananella hordeovulneris]MDO5080458.1 Fur family transcriptional regulator [Buchananella hordeovulneris]OKL51425.1 transcriptional repressor [Buchananella hordeovulneris]RRD44315.1 transcriptional repressor [Buchananella hordeovulneris]RRD51776.1 transcriptional repressor [Buchananella hordeovulneris]